MASLLKISEAASIGLHSACLLCHEPERVWSAREIATRLDVSNSHLSKVMNRMQKAGLVRSVIGPGGGFTLAKLPAEITLYDVLQGIDGPTGESACLFSPARCMGEGCVLGSISAEVNELVRLRMGSLTLADVASDTTQMKMLAIELLDTAEPRSGTGAKRKRKRGGR